jgi:hypothetical protein
MNDDSLIAAYMTVLRCHHVSVDELVATPQCRELFLSEARQMVGEVPESLLLMRLFNLRKRSKLPRARDI